MTLAISQNLGFSGLFLSTPPTITATGTAALFDDGNYCVVALATSGTALNIGGSADVDMGCGAISNSQDPTNSVVTNGNAYNFVADPVAAVGGMPSSINGATDLQPNHIAMQDPYANLPTAIPSGMTCTNWQPCVEDERGRHQGIPAATTTCSLPTVSGELSPGVYYFNNTDINLQGHEGLRGHWRHHHPDRQQPGQHHHGR